MRKVSIDATAIGRKEPIEVAVETGRVRQSIAVMKTIAGVQVKQKNASKASEAEQDAYVMDFLASIDDMLSAIIKYIGDCFGLNKKQREALETYDPEALQELAQNIAAAVMGFGDTAPTEDDQKSTTD